MGLIYGRNPVLEALNSNTTINKIYVQKGSKELTDIKKMAKEKKVVLVEAEKSKLDHMITKENEKLKNSQGVVASVTDYKYYDIEDILEDANNKHEKPFILVLDKIEDPHNLGAIIRTAECMGVHGIIIQKRNACQVTDTVEKVSAGACSYVKIARVTNITDAIRKLKENNIWVYGLDMDGDSNIYNTDFDGAVAIVVGNEGKGISRLVRDNCDVIVSIPMYGNINSLNASVSSAISVYEISKQRNNK